MDTEEELRGIGNGIVLRLYNLARHYERFADLLRLDGYPAEAARAQSDAVACRRYMELLPRFKIAVEDGAVIRDLRGQNRHVG